MQSLLADVHLTTTHLVFIGVAIIAVIGVCYGGSFLKSKLVKDRREAQDISAFLTEVGADDVADFMESFAVDDVPQMAHDFAALVKIARDPAKRTEAFAKIATKYCVTIVSKGDAAEISRLQGLLTDTPAQAAAAPTAPTGVDLQTLIAALNPTNYAASQSGIASSTLVTNPGSLNVPLPKVVTQVTHSVSAPAAPAPAASAAPAAA